MQSRSLSLLEAVANTAVGYLIALLLTMTVLPAFGYAIRLADGVAVSCVFTLASVLRGYLLRRLFARVI